jgi:hypothetical protein
VRVKSVGHCNLAVTLYTVTVPGLAMAWPGTGSVPKILSTLNLFSPSLS